jgi:hypothetical protein
MCRQVGYELKKRFLKAGGRHRKGTHPASNELASHICDTTLKQCRIHKTSEGWREGSCAYWAVFLDRTLPSSLGRWIPMRLILRYKVLLCMLSMRAVARRLK